HNAINEYREVASVAFLSLFDSHYFVGETKKYTEAYVFLPVKGLKNRRFVTGLDFALLYSSLIITYNLSPDKIILSQEHASVQHNNISEEKGLYTSVLEYLSEKKEDIDLIISSMGKGLLLSEAIKQILVNTKVEKRNALTKNLYYFIHKKKHEFIAEYDSICFNCSCLNKKQYAFKVYMNTFYGTAGNNFIKRKGFVIKYDDTDSLYLVCSEKCFQRCDEAYDRGNGISKEEYWSRMVEISMVEMEKLHDEVNVFLKEDNGSSYLKMAYKEVLFLVVFTGKKKYHEQSSVFRKIGKRIIDESLKVNNIRTLHQIIEDILRESVKDISWTDLNDSIKTAV
ncbi:8714_t:CDS:2, partial [Funneliformis geosporum]